MGVLANAVTKAGESGYSAAIEAKAKELGFRNAEEMILFNRQLEMKRDQTTGQNQPKAAPRSTPTPAKQSRGGLLDYVLNAWKGATN